MPPRTAGAIGRKRQVGVLASRNRSNRPAAPPRVVEPRTTPNPKWPQTRAISSPSALWLTMIFTLVLILAGAKSDSCQKT